MEKDPSMLHMNFDEIEKGKFEIIKKVAYFAFVIHVLLILFFAHIGALTLAIANFFSILAWGSGIFLITQGLNTLAIRVFCIEVVAHSTLSCVILGLDAGFQFYLWAISSILLVDYQLRLKRAFIYSFSIILLFAALYYFFSGTEYTYSYPNMLPYINIANIVIAGAPMVYAFGFFREITIVQRLELTEMAAKDHLTKLYNRRFAKKLIIDTRKKSIISDTQTCLVMADIDLFKNINDTYGHDKGDTILITVANTITDHLTDEDIVVRWGGEEFLIVLPNTNEAEALIRIEALRVKIQALSPLTSVPELTLTMSFGLIEWRPLASFEKTIQLADRALYKSKEKGRNQTTIANESKAHLIKTNPFKAE